MTTFLLVFFWLALASLYVALKGGLSNIARGRKYKSGTGWCAWRWTDVDSEYILRLHVFKTPWFAVCLHWIRKPDAEPWLHDHPVSFLSLVLRGQYVELRRKNGGRPYHKVNRWFNFVRASERDTHRIILCRSNTLTLCFMGPKTREWGFHVWDEIAAGGWIFWKTYYARLKAGEPLRTLPMQTAEHAANFAGERYLRSQQSLRDNPWSHEEKTLDTAPADDFNAEEATWPADHK